MQKLKSNIRNPFFFYFFFTNTSMLLCWKYYTFIFLKCLRKRNTYLDSLCYFHSINFLFLHGLHLSVSQQSKHYRRKLEFLTSTSDRIVLCVTHLLPRVYQLNEPPRGKTNNVVSEQVRQKPACTSTEKS